MASLVNHTRLAVNNFVTFILSQDVLSLIAVRGKNWQKVSFISPAYSTCTYSEFVGKATVSSTQLLGGACSGAFNTPSHMSETI